MKLRRWAKRSLLARMSLLLLCDALLLLAFALLLWYDNAVNRGITFAPDPTAAPIAHADAVPPVGLNVYHLHMEADPAHITRTLELARDMGVRYVRMQMPWEDVEIHAWGDFEDRRHLETRGAISAWDKYDQIVDCANRLDLDLVLRLDRPPAWARTEALKRPEWYAGIERDPASTGPPDAYGDYSAFVSAVASRYRGRVRYYQIWNEPNLRNEWNWQEPSPEDFARLLKFGSAAIKAADPQALIVFPSLAPVDGLDMRAPMTELEYLDRVYQAGAGDFFDIMSVQAYGLGQPPSEHRYVRLRPFDKNFWTRPLDTRVDVSRLVLVQEVMARHGDRDKAIWVSEFGWNSAPESVPTERRNTWGPPVSEQQKADYLIGHLERARDEWPQVGVMFVWMLRYGGYQEPDPADPTPYFALVTREWEPLPASTRLREHLAQPAVAGVGVHAWEHAAVERIEGGDGWRIRFSGDALLLVGGLSGSLERVKLDGSPITLMRDGLSTGEATLATLPRDRDRTRAVHVLEVVAPGAAAPTRFVVSRQQPLPWLWSAGPGVLAMALLLALLATLHTAYTLTDLAFAAPRARR